MLRDLRHSRDMKMLAIDVANRVDQIDKKIDDVQQRLNQLPEDVGFAERLGIEMRRDDLFSERAIALQEPARSQTKFLLTQAAELGIPVAEDEQFWEVAHGSLHERLLTTAGIDALRKNIRREVKERIDVIQSRLAIIFGTIGAITGIISLILTLNKDT